MKEIKQIRVFISSPGDLEKERAVAVEVCKQITSDLGSNKGFVIDPIRWESHTVSARSSRSQLAISKQLGQYDIYLGIMGYYFGTTTGEYASGTEEEFEDALRLNIKTGSPWISFYFSSANVDPDKIDLEQYQLVKKFRQKLKDHGVYYRKFQDLTHFQALVRKGITKVILEMLDKIPSADASYEHAKPTNHTSLRPYEVLRHLKMEFESNPSTAVHILMMEATRNLDEFSSYLTRGC